jgi:hypothetical protein
MGSARHGMRTLLYVDDLLIACSSFEEASRARHIIEETLLAADIRNAADYSMYSTFPTASPGSVLFSRSNLLKESFYLRAAISDCLLIGFIRATETLRKN